MKKLVLPVLMSATLTLAACGAVPTVPTKVNDLQTNFIEDLDNDTLLWTNADGTDCDYGDYLEGDSDCKKKKKTVYKSVDSAGTKSSKPNLKTNNDPSSTTKKSNVNLTKPKTTVTPKNKTTSTIKKSKK